ncbi:hypothetical protein QJQ45_028884 [Haematococcus lacustris]|nr:hypothetical protein QJQ45_028869 [Haematococcus lacustris]KAJ9530973.1 hypothetical protein QJQ45_028884 [Haematococcus lacustris]
MVDNIVTGNIISQQYLMRNGLRLATTLSPRRLLLPGPKHTTLPTYTLPPCSIRMGTYRDRLQLSMANIPNPSFDIALSKPCLAAKNPCVECINNGVRLDHAGSTHTLTPPPLTPLQADQLLTTSATSTLPANLAKCAFRLHTVDFPGHVVSAAGIQLDPTKVKAVLDWPALQDKHQLRSLLNIANYYRRLLHHHAHRVLPLIDLLRDEQPWRWGEAEQRALVDIQAAMASSPVYVVAYGSRKLNLALVNYPAHERELLAVLHALTTWRHYLLSRPFIVETNISATTHVLTQSNLTGRQMRCCMKLMTPTPRAKTLKRLQRHFYWPQMHKTVQEYVRTGDKCPRNKATNQLPLASTPRGHTMIFTIVDKLSKMIHLIPTTTTATAHNTARLFFDHIFKHHGLSANVPRRGGSAPSLTTSNSSTRTSFVFRWTKRCPFKPGKAVPFHPNFIPLGAVFAYNSSEHAGTGFTPFYLNYGHHPTTPSTLLLPPPTLVPSQAEDFVTSMCNNLTVACSAMQRSIDTQKLHADQHRRHEEFEVGDLVQLSCVNLNSQTAVNNAKMQPRFVGPFKVLAKHSSFSYKLDLPSSMRILPTFHISRPRPYLSSSSFPERAVELQPSPVIIDGEVERVDQGRGWSKRVR